MTREATASARDQLRQRSLFLADLSAELHGELNAVLGLGRRLMDTDLTAPQRKLASALHARCDGLLSRLAAVSDFSNLKAGRVDLLRECFSLTSEVRATVAYHARGADRKGLRLSTRLPTPLPAAVEADRGRLRQVMSYLLRNAIHSAAGGAIAVETMLVDEDHDSAEVRFAVAVEMIDDAARENLSRLFDAGEDEPVDHQVWSAVGLAICRDLAHLMGGAIGFEVDGGEGARFWLTTVLKKAATCDEPVRAADDEDERLRILLVSSKPEITCETLIALHKHGYEVTHGEDRRDMEETLRRESFCLVLMEGELPTRVATLACWAETGGLRDVPVVGVPMGANGLDAARLVDVVRLWSRGGSASGTTP